MNAIISKTVRTVLENDSVLKNIQSQFESFRYTLDSFVNDRAKSLPVMKQPNIPPELESHESGN